MSVGQHETIASRMCIGYLGNRETVWSLEGAARRHMGNDTMSKIILQSIIGKISGVARTKRRQIIWKEVIKLNDFCVTHRSILPPFWEREKVEQSFLSEDIYYLFTLEP